MSDEPKIPEGEAPRWLDHAINRTRVYQAVTVAFALSVAAGFLPYEHHPYFPFESIPGFAAFYGLVTCIGLVLSVS